MPLGDRDGGRQSGDLGVSSDQSGGKPPGGSIIGWSIACGGRSARSGANATLTVAISAPALAKAWPSAAVLAMMVVRS